MKTFTLYDEEGYFVSQVTADTVEEAIALLGVDPNIDVVVQ
jgi:hypothetical protein